MSRGEYSAAMIDLGLDWRYIAGIYKPGEPEILKVVHDFNWNSRIWNLNFFLNGEGEKPSSTLLMASGSPQDCLNSGALRLLESPVTQIKEILSKIESTEVIRLVKHTTVNFYYHPSNFRRYLLK